MLDVLTAENQQLRSNGDLQVKCRKIEKLMPVLSKLVIEEQKLL